MHRTHFGVKISDIYYHDRSLSYIYVYVYPLYRIGCI